MIALVDEFFDLTKTMESGQCVHFRKLGEHKYQLFGEKQSVIAEQDGHALTMNCTDAEYLSYWRTYLGLEIDYGNVWRYLKHDAESKHDEYALKCLEYSKGVHILKQPIFETCCSFILQQQSGKRYTQQILFDLSKKYGTKCGNDTYLFPTPSELYSVTENDYRQFGIGRKAKYLRTFILCCPFTLYTRNVDYEKKYENGISVVLSEDAYSKNMKILLSFFGIGDRVANCICMYGLGHLSGFYIDAFVKRILRENYTEKAPFVKPHSCAGILQEYMTYYARSHS